jgi:hypothetical protein
MSFPTPAVEFLAYVSNIPSHRIESLYLPNSFMPDITESILSSSSGLETVIKYTADDVDDLFRWDYAEVTMAALDKLVNEGAISKQKSLEISYYLPQSTPQ